MGIPVSATLEQALAQPADVLIDYTGPEFVKGRILEKIERGVRVVGTSGLTAPDYADIDRAARQRNLGVIAASNFSVTAALAKHFALFAARYVPSWEIIDYADANKIDAPGGTTRKLAEELACIAQSQPVCRSIRLTASEKRGATVGGRRSILCAFPATRSPSSRSSACPTSA